MTVKLSHLRHEVKTSKMALVPNPNHPLGMGLAYKQLKSLGWLNHNSEIHPADRVPVFRLAPLSGGPGGPVTPPSGGSGGASIRRNKSNRSHWIVEVAGGEFEADGNLAELTEQIQQLAAEAEAQAQAAPPLSSPPSGGLGGMGGRGGPEGPEVRPRSLAQEIAADILAEAPYLNGRVEAGLKLFEAGVLEFPKYRTSYHLANGGKTARECECPDAYHRGFRASFGRACKHTIAQEIAWRVQQAENAVKQRVIADKQDSHRREQRSILDYLDYGDEESAERLARLAETGQNFRQPTSQWKENQAAQTSRIDAARLIEYERQLAEDQAKIEANAAAYNLALSPGGGGPLHRPRAEFRGIGHR